MRSLILAILFLTATPALAQLHLAADAKELTITQGLAIDGLGQWGRRAINVDAIAALVVEGTLGDPTTGIPKAGDTILPPVPLRSSDFDAATDARVWREIGANDKGEFTPDKPGAYILAHIQSAKGRVMILEARGHAMLYENGFPRMGDPYSAGFVKIPVAIREGDNVLLFAHAGRGPMSARLVEPRADLMVLTEDITAPDILRGSTDLAKFSIPIANTTYKKLVGSIEIDGEGHGNATMIVHFGIEPLSVCKVDAMYDATPPEGAKELKVTIHVEKVQGETRTPCDSRDFTLQVVEPGEARRVTFESAIDGSTQYYAVLPPARPAEGAAAGARPGLVLSLHGASVEAISQARSYAPKDDLVIVCPTNRRPFGFDWEDWGRADAMEVLRHASNVFDTDPARQYLTGHSMGGHGTWQLGVHYPDRFAAIAPSAGWPSFETYSGSAVKFPGADSPFTEVFKRAAATSETLSLMEQLKGRGIYILHGDADDNVPVAQARLARERLDALKIHHEFHEQPGAGHWWDDDKPGAACVDWPPIFDLFARSTLENPPARDARLVTRLIDGRSMPRGSFKRAFSGRFTFVYGTKGTREENFASFGKARYDAEQWWYRGNGGAELIPDEVARRHPGEHNIIIYGNADVNSAWSLVDASSTVLVERGKAAIGSNEWTGDDIGVLAVARMEHEEGMTMGDEPPLLVGIVAGTGRAGQRTLDRIPYFTSGAGIPDQLVLRAAVWMEGMSAVEHAATSNTPK